MGNRYGSLWVNFKLAGEDYCISDQYMRATVIPEKIIPMPNPSPYVLGVTKFASGQITLLNLRAILGMQTLEEDIQNFTTMRQMHVDWIEALKNTVYHQVPFNKALDPHKCKFGKWYDHYRTDNFSLNFILKKIEEPHAFIHHCGAEVMQLIKTGNYEEAKKVYKKAEEVCKNTLLPLLDELIKVYKESNRGMAIVLQDAKDMDGLALMVDEVSTLVPVDRTEVCKAPAGIRNRYVSNIVLYESKMMTNIDVEAIGDIVNRHAAQATVTEEIIEA